MLNCMGSMKMNVLNKCLMEHISSQLGKDPSCNLVPVFGDYQSHVSDISAKYSSDVEAQSSTSVAAVTASSTGAGEYAQRLVVNS